MDRIGGISHNGDTMLEAELVKRALQAQQTPIVQDDHALDVVVAYQAAASLRLEGIVATPEDVLLEAQTSEPRIAAVG